MDEQREESEFVGDFGEPMEESGKKLGLSSKTEALDGEDATTVEVSDSCVCDVSATDGNPNDGDSANEDGNTDNSVSDEKYVKADVASVEGTVEEGGAIETEDNVERTDEPEIERNDMECEGDAGEEETVTSAGNEVADEMPNGGASDAEQDVQTEKSQQSSVDGETLSVAEDEADQKKESTKKSEEDNDKMGADSKQEEEVKVGVSYNEQRDSGCEASDAEQEKESVKKSDEDNNKMDVDSKQAKEENEQGNPGDETTDAKHSESAQVPEEPAQLSKGDTDQEICLEEEITNVNQKGENGEAMEIDYAAEEQVEKDVKVGCTLDNTGNESAGASVVQTQDIRIAEADGNDSNVVKEMEIDERKENVDMSTDLSGTFESADSANPHSPSEDAATGEVEPLDHNALFDPSSDITNFIDFSGVSCWSGNIQDLKTETNVSLKEDKKAIDLAEEVATVDCKETLKSVDATVNAESHDNLRSAEGIQNESSEACVAFGAESLATATEYPREASDAIMGSDENQEEKGHECLDKKVVDQQAATREEDDSTHEAPSIEPNQKEDTEMEENPNNSDYADDGTDSDIKTNGVKRKADVLSDDSPGEGMKTVSFAKVSFAQRPSFKIGACIARAASQMAGSPSVLKGSNFGDETLSVESFVSQLHCAATDPDKENIVSEIAAGFFLDFRNSSASQQVTTEKVGSKRGRPPNSTAGGTEAFEFEEMGDTYWTDRVIHNGGEEQTPSTEKGNYQVVPVELKPAQVQRTRRPYRRRQSQISIPLPSASDKPANFDENAPAELIMNFSETDTIPPEKSLSKMFRHFGPIRESQTEVDQDNNRARVVYRKSTDAEVAYNSAARFSIFGTKAVNYELSYTITEAFKVHPYVVSLGEEDAAHCLPS